MLCIKLARWAVVITCIEIQQGSDGYIWIMVHSGSRNLGFTVANHYHQIASKLNTADGENVTSDLAYIPESSEYFELYKNRNELLFGFALANRTLMMERGKPSSRYWPKLSLPTLSINLITSPPKKNILVRQLSSTPQGTTRAPRRMGDDSGSIKARALSGYRQDDAIANSCAHGADVL